MGQAKQRGSALERVAQAKEQIEASKPKSITCNHCQAELTEIETLDIRGMTGLTGAFVADCNCGNNTIALQGDPEASAWFAQSWAEHAGAKDQEMVLQKKEFRGNI